MKGVSGQIEKVLASLFLSVISFAMMVSIGLEHYFGRKSFRPLGSWTTNMDLKID